MFWFFVRTSLLVLTVVFPVILLLDQMAPLGQAITAANAAVEVEE